jgi:hypothetical protein
MRNALNALAGIGAMTCILTLPNAAQADPVTDTTSYSQQNRLSLFHDYSIDVVGQTKPSIPGSPGSGVMNPLLGQYASTDAEDSGRWYELSATPLAGYDSNPDASRFPEGGAFVGLDLSAAIHCNFGPYDPTVGSPNQFKLSYDITGAVYEGQVGSADAIQQTLNWSYRRNLFNDRVFIGMGIADQFTVQHGEAIANSFDAIPSAEWLMIPQTSVEVSYDYTNFSFFRAAADRKSMDTDRHTVNLKLHLYATPQVRGPIPESPDVLGDILRQTLYRATIGYAAVFNNALGIGYQYEGNRLQIGFEGVRIPQLKFVPDLSMITMDMMYAHEWDNYMNPSLEGPQILAGSPKHIRRKDHIDVFTLRANARLLDLSGDRGTLAGYLQCDIIADRANILVRHYNEYVFSGGFTYRY